LTILFFHLTVLISVMLTTANYKFTACQMPK
jgi:hypothetical protein